jgi:hypothetical protein
VVEVKPPVWSTLFVVTVVTSVQNSVQLAEWPQVVFKKFTMLKQTITSKTLSELTKVTFIHPLFC